MFKHPLTEQEDLGSVPPHPKSFNLSLVIKAVEKTENLLIKSGLVSAHSVRKKITLAVQKGCLNSARGKK